MTSASGMQRLPTDEHLDTKGQPSKMGRDLRLADVRPHAGLVS